MTRLLLILLLLLPCIAEAKLKVVASITPLASLVAMVAGNIAEVSVITQTESCPHHYALKPSDLKKIQGADAVIYLSDDFDHFAGLLAQKSNATVIKIADVRGLELLEHNWHLWLLPENARIIAEHIEGVLEKISPENALLLQNNLKEAVAKLEALERERLKALGSGTKFILLTDSAEYLFKGTQAQRLYPKSDYSTLQELNALKNSDHSACYVISTDQDLGRYRSILGTSSHIVQISTENWASPRGFDVLYYQAYENILNTLRCR